MCDEEVLSLEDAMKNKPGEILSILYQIKFNEYENVDVIRYRKMQKLTFKHHNSTDILETYYVVKEGESNVDDYFYNMPDDLIERDDTENMEEEDIRSSNKKYIFDQLGDIMDEFLPVLGLNQLTDLQIYHVVTLSKPSKKPNTFIYKCYKNIYQGGDSNGISILQYFIKYMKNIKEYHSYTDITPYVKKYNNFIKSVNTNNKNICDKVKTMSDKNMMELSIKRSKGSLKYLYELQEDYDKDTLFDISSYSIDEYLSRTN